MTVSVRCGPVLVLLCAAAIVSCGGDGSPTSPSAVVPPAVRTVLAIQPSDHHEGGTGNPEDPHAHHPVPPPEPAPSPQPDPVTLPEPFPAPGPVPGPDPLPGPAPLPDPGSAPPANPTAVVIAIVGSFGPGAFMPNPITAPVGHTITWMNTDVTQHHIVLADGTVIGDLLPGQSSAPMPVTTATVGFVCTIHPSMVGLAFDPALAAPPPVTEPVPPIGPPGTGYPDPDPYEGPYGDEYDDY